VKVVIKVQSNQTELPTIRREMNKMAEITKRRITCEKNAVYLHMHRADLRPHVLVKYKRQKSLILCNVITVLQKKDADGISRHILNLLKQYALNI
jgi:hypothetical protein